MSEIDLHFIAQQIDRLVGEVGTLREEVRALSEIVMRLDSAPGDPLARMVTTAARKLEDHD